MLPYLLKDDIELVQKYARYFREITTFYDTINSCLGNSRDKFFAANHFCYSDAVTILERKLEEMEKEKVVSTDFYPIPNAGSCNMNKVIG